jgi:hypothetical protein
MSQSKARLERVLSCSYPVSSTLGHTIANRFLQSTACLVGTPVLFVSLCVAKLILIPPPREKWRTLKPQSRQTGSDLGQKTKAPASKVFIAFESWELPANKGSTTSLIWLLLWYSVLRWDTADYR